MKFLHKTQLFKIHLRNSKIVQLKRERTLGLYGLPEGQAASALGKSFDAQGEVTRILIIPTLEFT